MTDDRLPDQELVVHAAAPLDGPHAARAYEELGQIWSRCRELLGVTEPIPNTGLATTLPTDPRGDAREQALAGAQDRTGDFQLIARRLHDVVNLSMAFAAPLPPRRIRIGSAVPPGWIEFDRWWREVAADATSSFLGVTRVFQAKHASLIDTPPSELRAVVRAALPRDGQESVGWDEEQASPDGFVSWEPQAHDMEHLERLIVVLASEDDDVRLSAWTWSNGGTTIPPLGRYLVHAAKIRYEMRVWQSERPAIEELRRHVDGQVARLQRDLADPAGLDQLAANIAELAVTTSNLREMQHTVRIAAANMKAAVAEPLRRDRGLADRFTQELEDAAVYLDLAHQRAGEILELALRSSHLAVPDSADRPRSLDAERVRRHDVGPDQGVTRPRKAPPGDIKVRMGFAVDIVIFSSRSSPQKNDLQQRLADLVDGVLHDLCISLSDTDHQGTGDGINIFLPETTEVHRALPALLRSFHDRLTRDNARFRDRMRLRIATAVGPTGLAALGFSGKTIVDMHRLLNSEVLRRAALDHPNADLVALVSDQLYSWVIGEGYPGLDPARFQRVSVRVKEFSEHAWLWVGD